MLERILGQLKDRYQSTIKKVRGAAERHNLGKRAFKAYDTSTEQVTTFATGYNDTKALAAMVMEYEERKIPVEHTITLIKKLAEFSAAMENPVYNAGVALYKKLNPEEGKLVIELKEKIDKLKDLP
jgi:hypothetical protein